MIHDMKLPPIVYKDVNSEKALTDEKMHILYVIKLPYKCTISQVSRERYTSGTVVPAPEVVPFFLTNAFLQRYNTLCLVFLTHFNELKQLTMI